MEVAVRIYSKVALPEDLKFQNDPCDKVLSDGLLKELEAFGIIHWRDSLGSIHCTNPEASLMRVFQSQCFWDRKRQCVDHWSGSAGDGTIAGERCWLTLNKEVRLIEIRNKNVRLEQDAKPG
jgi:hypothetical protein